MTNQTGKSKPKFELSLLQTFYLVAQHGSFSSASRKLNISYQSAANHVRRLESMYGARLVEAEKGSRSVKLTPQGKALYAIFGTELETIFARISVLMQEERSVLRIGVPQAIFHHFLPRIISLFKEQEPGISLDFFERDTQLEDMMLNGELDACVSERYFGEAAISQVLLGEYPLSLIYPRDWSYGEINQDNFKILLEAPFITYEPGQTIRSRAVDFLKARLGADPKILATSSGSTSLKAMVSEGLGFAIVPNWLVPDDDPIIGKVQIESLKKMKVYLGYSAFLADNDHLAVFNAICRDQIGSRLDSAQDV
ncbi:LysR family transcriptional regulator [uncultured Cohaesibacter sp.]|uniref:LysR family transcriptional regulator n=1 Tax=uncultured Cohaesibacter sp. TaxID=1002546 RepID=UPI0029C8E83A|nr:LysR family transcriptional regulator [uncultured Cohaesibacter sp.]